MSLELEGYEKKLKRFVSPTFSGENNDLGRVCNFLKNAWCDWFKSVQSVKNWGLLFPSLIWTFVLRKNGLGA